MDTVYNQYFKYYVRYSFEYSAPGKDRLESLCMIGMMNRRRGRDRPRKGYTDSLIEITERNHMMTALRRMMRDFYGA